MSAKPDAPAGRPTVFISYSHLDEVWKDRLETALKALGIRDGLEIWSDSRIDRGNREGAERHRAKARKLVEETGYGRRWGEVGLA